MDANLSHGYSKHNQLAIKNYENNNLSTSGPLLSLGNTKVV